MDRVRFGRALGFGAREAAKALAKAADAAAAPNPAGRAAGHKVGETVVRAKATGAGLKRGGKRFGEAVWGPFVRVGGVLWLEVTGVFFGLFAVTAGLHVWRRRADLAGVGEARQHAWFALGMMIVFGWFTVSSFVRANRRGKG